MNKIPKFCVKGIIFFLIITSIFSNISHAQKQTGKFTRISIQQGLSQSIVNTIFQDSRGFIWVGTQDGLNRYDGYEFVNYFHSPSDPNSLSQNYITATAEDNAGNIWIATRGGGLNEYKRNTDKFIKYLHIVQNMSSDSQLYLQAVAVDNSGYIWYGGFGSGLIKFNPNNFNYQNYITGNRQNNSICSDTVTSILCDSGGTVWIGTSNGLSILNPAKNIWKTLRNIPGNSNSLSDNYIRCIIKDRNGFIWIGTDNGGLNKYNPKNQSFTRYIHNKLYSNGISGNSINSLFEDRDGKIWIGVWQGGVCSLNPETGEFINYRNNISDDQSISSDDINVVYKDQSDVLWVGTYGGGLNMLNPMSKLFTHYKKKINDRNSLANNQIYSIYKDSRNILWIGTWGGGLDSYNPATDIYTHYRKVDGVNNSISDNKISSITEDSDNNLWIGTIDGGLNKLNKDRTVFTKYKHVPGNPNSICSNRINTLYIDRKGSLWIGSLDNGLSILDLKTAKIINYKHDSKNSSSISDNRINFIHEDYDGDYWIGTSDGLNILKKGSNTFKVYKNIHGNNNSLSGNWISCINQTDENNLWIGTYGGGLNKITVKNGILNFRYFSRSEGLPNSFIYNILADKNGKLWFGTNNGLVNFDPTNSHVRVFDYSDGLQSNEFKPGAYFDKNKDIMYFGGINGFNSFEPESIKRETSNTKILLTSFKIFNKEAEVGNDSPLKQAIGEIKEIKLSYKDYLFSIGFSSTNYASQDRQKFAYKLEGLDKFWNYTDSKLRVATYNSLPGGTYTFIVRPLTGTKVKASDEARLTIIIVPPFYSTWWFRILLLLSLTSLLAAGFIYRTKVILKRNKVLEEKVNLRTQELEEVNKTKDKFFSIIAHDLKSPFQTLLGSSEVLYNEYGMLTENEKKEFILTIHDTIKNTYTLLDNLLQWAKLQINLVDYNPEVLNLATTLLPTIDMLRNISKNKNININFLINFDIDVIADKNMLTTTVRNLLSNAVKFVPYNGNIYIRASLRNDFVKISVADTGNGLSPEVLSKLFKIDAKYSTRGTAGEKGTGLGLLLCKEMVEKMGGRIYVKSELGNGSTFSFTVPRYKLLVPEDESKIFMQVS